MNRNLRWGFVIFAAGALAVSTTARATDVPARPVPAGVVRITPVTRNSAVSKASLKLAAKGKALLPIIISPKASPATKSVATELAGYLTRISGAPFTVTNGDGLTGIVVGSLAEFPAPELAEPLAIFNTFDGREAYAIRTQAKRLLLISATDLGASHAVFRFLEELGVRWLFPAKEWEVVPNIPALQFSRDITDRPAILSRVIWFEAGSGGERQNAEYAA